MNFLDLPREPLEHEGAKIVPLFMSWPYKYEDGPFLQYHKKHPDAFFGDGETLKYESEIEYHYQNWLFFGLLHEVLQDAFHEEEFVCWDDVKQTNRLTTRKLPEILKHWHETRSAEVLEADPEFKHLSECLGEVWYMLELTERFFMGHGEVLGLQIDVIAAVAEAITNTLMKSVDKIRNRDGQRFNWLIVSYQGRTDVLNRTIDRMIADGGWCRNDVTRALGIFDSVEAWHFIRHLRLSDDATVHEDCVLDECSVSVRKNESMFARHTRPRCRCSSIRIGSRRLARVYRVNRLPCMRLWKDHDAGLCHEWYAANLNNPKTRYHALSHVWSQGTGNGYENALPKCQLTEWFDAIESWRDARFPDEAGSSIVLWIDTLCCPAKQGEGKTLALSRMREIYTHATGVHMWDESIRSWFCGSGQGQPDSLEVMVRIIFSPWMRRLWTAQEAIFSGPPDHSSLIIHNENGCNSLTAIYREAATSERFASTFAFDASKELVWIDGGRSAWVGRGGKYIPGMLSKAGELMQYRATSVASDEPLVLANLYGFDIQRYLGLDSERGMCQFWSDLNVFEVGAIPKDIVFSPTPKLSTPGFRWAPKTLLNAKKHTPSIFLSSYFVDGVTPRSTCEVTSDGLSAAYKGVRVLPVASPKARCFLGGHDTDCGKMFCNIMIPLSSGDWLRASCTFSDNDVELEKLYQIFRRLRAGNLAFIVQRSDILFEPTKTHAYQLIYEREVDGVHWASLEQYAVIGKYREYPVILERAAQKCALQMLEALEKSQKYVCEGDSTFLDEHVRGFLQVHPEICDVTRKNSRENLNAKKDWTFEQVVDEFKQRVHHQGHIGPIQVIELDADTKWHLT